MLDIKMIRSQPEMVRERLAFRNPGDAERLDQVIALDQQHRRVLLRAEEIKARVNVQSREIGERMRSGDKEGASAQQEEVRALKADLAAIDGDQTRLHDELEQLLLVLPNLLHESVPPGGEDDAVTIRTEEGSAPLPTDRVPHWDIAERLGIIDFTRATKLSGSGFVLYKGAGARLERALVQWMLDTHIEKHGYEEWSTPYFLNRQSVTASAHIVKFSAEMYHDEESDLFALPTAEPALLNIHRDEILGAGTLPRRYTAYSPCWRREAGSAGKDTRGLLRVHQFDKVELFSIAEPDKSYEELDRMLSDAVDIVETLGLTYRVQSIAAADVSFAGARQYDIEVYSPGVDRWLEVSSCSNCTDFQARRAGLRFRGEDGKAHFAHLLNGSGTALPRILAALLETYVQADGSVNLPNALSPYMPSGRLTARAASGG